MTATPAGWPAHADDDGALPPDAAESRPEPGGFNPSFRERGMTGSQPAGRSAAAGGTAVSVLADRLAAALVHHEPGWRLPRHSALARRYNVSPSEIDTAVEELVGRHLVRRLADGQIYRASPAEYLLSLEGVPGLLSFVDAMGGELCCRSRQVTWRLPPEDIGWALRVSAEQQVCVVRFLWTAGGEPAALCTTYVPGDVAGPAEVSGLPTILNLVRLTGINLGEDGIGAPAGSGTGSGAAGAASTTGPGNAAGPGTASGSAGRRLTGTPAALHIEMQAPPPSVARSLRLTPGQPAVMVTVRFDDTDSGRPVALSVAVLRPDMFRVVVQTEQPPLPDETAGNPSGSWTHAVDGWEP